MDLGCDSWGVLTQVKAGNVRKTAGGVERSSARFEVSAEIFGEMRLETGLNDALAG